MESAMHDPNINRSSYLSRRSSLERSIKHYSNFHQILLVGEGDFSFSSALANAFGSTQHMVPTSLNSREELLQLYKSAHEPLSNLEKLGAMILHGVDATTMEKHPIIRKMKFHRIVYNFPHASFHGKEEDKNVIEKHRDLLKMFFKNARSILSEIGEIHVTHKAYGPYRRWELVKQAEECGLLLKESVHFALEDYPGYTNRRGAGSAAGFPFPLGECQTYKFVLGPDLFYLRKLVAIQVVLSNFSSEASVESFQTAILEPESEMQARMSESLCPMHTNHAYSKGVHELSGELYVFGSITEANYVAFALSMTALKQPSIRVVAILAEGVPEGDTKQLIAYARANNKVIIGPVTVVGIYAGAFKIGDTAGMIDNIIQCKLYISGSVGFVSKSGGMSNELYNIITHVTNGIYEGIAIGGDVFPSSTLSDHVLGFNNIPQVNLEYRRMDHQK